MTKVIAFFLLLITRIFGEDKRGDYQEPFPVLVNCNKQSVYW